MWSTWHPGLNTRATAEIEKPRANRPDILAVLHAEIGGEPGVEPWRPIPVQRVQVVANRVRGVLSRNCLNATTHHPDLSGNPLVLKPFTCAGIVVVRPAALLFDCSTAAASS